MAVRGDTATGVNTRAVTETGLEVQVPAFVNAGDTIRIDTRTGTYVARV
jgi:elongation factor P